MLLTFFWLLWLINFWSLVFKIKKFRCENLRQNFFVEKIKATNFKFIFSKIFGASKFKSFLRCLNFKLWCKWACGVLCLLQRLLLLVALWVLKKYNRLKFPTKKIISQLVGPKGIASKFNTLNFNLLFFS